MLGGMGSRAIAAALAVALGLYGLTAAASQFGQRFSPCGVKPLGLLGQVLISGQLCRRQLAALAARDEPAEAAFVRRRQTHAGGAKQCCFVGLLDSVLGLAGG